MSGEAVVDRVRQAHADRDWPALRLLLHPYLHWTDSSGAVTRGRTTVLGLLAQVAELDRPLHLELRDGQVYRWTCR